MAMSNHSDNAVENTVLSGDEEVNICYFELLSFDDFFREEKFFWLPFKNKVSDENLHFQGHSNFLVKLQVNLCQKLFSLQNMG